MKPHPGIEGPGDLFALLASKGSLRYPGEEVTQIEHALQTAELARRAGARAELVLASLLHDVGHLVVDTALDADDLHEVRGATLLAGLFGPSVAEPVRLHVAAKRYL